MADVATNAHSTVTAQRNGSVVVNCSPTGTSFTIDTSTDSNHVEFDASLTPSELEALYTGRFDDIAYYNAVDGGSP